MPEEKRKTAVRIEAQHIDGTMNSRERNEKLSWLKSDIVDDNECRLLCNVRCLSEGVDVPALDAVVFLSARNSQIDVVQSVGRVMRNFRKGKPGEKKYGYIIIPVVVNPGIKPEEALNDNQRFAVVWSILNALRSHDDSFNATINRIALNKEKPSKIIVGSVEPFGDKETSLAERQEAAALVGEAVTNQLSLLDELKNAIYAKMVGKVGDRLYWEKWANDVGIVARNFIGRITELVSIQGKHQDEFAEFVKALQVSINEAISEAQAVEMLAQHLITRPVFDALFKDYKFATNNAVCRSMERMIEVLVEAGMEKDTSTLDSFYDSVRMNVGDIDNLAGKQTVIKNLYEKFFRGAFPKTVDQLGIVYTPVECVDFITIIKYRSITSRAMPWQTLEPNEHGDWLNKRTDLFGSFVLIGDKKEKSQQVFFEPYYSRGLQTNRDAWCYNSSFSMLRENIIRMIDFYNEQCGIVKKGGEVTFDSTKFSWTRAATQSLEKNRKYQWLAGVFTEAQYRPFCKQCLYFSREINEMVNQIPQIFPTPQHKNLVICVNGTGSRKDFASIISDHIPDLEIIENPNASPYTTINKNPKAKAAC